MQKNVTLLLALLICLFASQSSAQTQLYALIFAATEDKTIKEGTRKSLDLITAELDRIEDVTNGEINVTSMTYTANQFTKAQFQAAVDELEKLDLSDATVLFYFMGHGFRHVEYDSPNLLFHHTNGRLSDAVRDNSSLNLQDIHNILKNLDARLTISIGEACNTRLDKSKDAQFSDNVGNINVTAPKNIQKERYEELFMMPEGHVILQSSLKGQYSYISDLYGGMFTQAFVNTLHNMLSDAAPARWGDLVTRVGVNTNELVKKANRSEKQFPVGVVNVENEPVLSEPSLDKDNLGVIIDEFQQSKKLKKAVKDMVKGKLPRSRVYRQLQESSTAEINLKYQPFSHHLVLGLFAEQLNEDPSDIFLFYSIARNLYEQKPPKLSIVDKKVIEKIERLAKRKNKKSDLAAAIHKAKGVWNWLMKVQEESEAVLKEKLKDIQGELATIYDVIAEINRQIDEEQEQIDRINQEIDDFKAQIQANKDTIAELEIFKQTRVNVSINDVGAIDQASLREMQAYINCLQTTGNAANCQASKAAILATSAADVNLSLDSTTTTGRLVPNTKAFQIGKSCNDKVQEVTKLIAQPLLSVLNIVPRKSVYMDDIVISGTITGFADYRGAGRLLNIRFAPNEDIYITYENKYKEVKKVRFNKGESKRITNEQLAFLRAYCAFQVLQDEINAATNGMIDVDNKRRFNIDFVAVEQSKKDAAASSDFRGVSIDLNVKNLYKFLEDRIGTLDSKNRKLQRAIQSKETERKVFEDNIASLQRRIDQYTTEIDMKEKEAEELEKAIYQNGLYGSEVVKITRGIKGGRVIWTKFSWFIEFN